jgi:hypothetical protein
LQALPADAVAAAQRWREHVVEVQTGLRPDEPPGPRPRDGYDPAVTTLADRQRAKAAELGISVRTVEAKRARYTAQGLWGLVDQRVTRTFDITGRADPRLVEVIEQMLDAETAQSTGTRSRLIRRVIARVEQTYEPGVVALPRRSAFYALIDRLSVGRHTFGSAVTRRQLANRPNGMFTPTFAMRPGEQIQIDSTPIDVMVLAADGVPVRTDLTIAVDVATRSICAGVLRPVGTKAVDASLLLAKMMVPEPMRPGWPTVLRIAASQLPYERLVAIDARMREAAARPIIVPDQVVIDHGKVFVSEVFVRACDWLGLALLAASGRRRHPRPTSVLARNRNSYRMPRLPAAGQRGRDRALDEIRQLAPTQPPAARVSRHPRLPHGPPRYTDTAGQRRTLRSATWFGINRRGGNVILHHRHIRPVLIRDWSPRMDASAQQYGPAEPSPICRKDLTYPSGPRRSPQPPAQCAERAITSGDLWQRWSVNSGGGRGSSRLAWLLNSLCSVCPLDRRKGRSTDLQARRRRRPRSPTRTGRWKRQ